MKIKVIILVTIAALIAAAPSFANPDDTQLESPVPANDWNFKASAGAMVFYVPRYEGSDKYQSLYMPEINLEYGPIFASISQGAGIYIPVNESRSLIFAPAIRWRVKRNLGDARDAIEYIGDVRPTATLNTILKLDTFMFNFRMTEGLAQSNPGASFNLGITWQDYVTERINLTLYTTAIYGDKRYNQTYFGITPAESERFGFAVHDASAGLKSFDVGGLLKYLITERISIDFMLEYMRLVGPAAKSTITRDKNQLLFGIGATYRF